jgi:hypothetical protein
MGRCYPHKREIVIVNGFGSVYRLDERTTGQLRAKVEDIAKQVGSGGDVYDYFPALSARPIPVQRFGTEHARGGCRLTLIMRVKYRVSASPRIGKQYPAEGGSRRGPARIPFTREERDGRQAAIEAHT